MIHRIEHNDNFTVIANETVRNTELSDGAIRLLFFMLSCSDDYQFSTKGLAHVFDVSESTIVDRVVELKSKGYIQTTNRKNEKGRFTACSWDVFETPHTEISAYGKNRTRKSPHTGKTALGNSTPIRNNNIKEISNIKEIPIVKNTYGEFQNVFLSDEEFSKLGEQFGTEQRDLVLEQLSGYIVEHPKKYKNHFLTLRNWLLRRKNDKPTTIKPNPVPEESPFKKLLREEGYSI